MQRMCCHNRRNKCAAREFIRHPVKQPEQHQRIQNVENDVRGMMPAGIQTEKLNINHMGQPRHWMPIALMIRCQCPPNAIRCESGGDGGVCIHVIVVIKVNKRVVEDIRVYQQVENGKSHQYPEN